MDYSVYDALRECTYREVPTRFCTGVFAKTWYLGASAIGHYLQRGVCDSVWCCMPSAEYYRSAGGFSELCKGC